MAAIPHTSGSKHNDNRRKCESVLKKRTHVEGSPYVPKKRTKNVPKTVLSLASLTHDNVFMLPIVGVHLVLFVVNRPLRYRVNTGYRDELFPPGFPCSQNIR